MGDSTVPLAAIGLVATILTLVVTPLFKLLRENTKALSKVAEASEKVATATTKSANEAKERNGHLGEQSYKIAELITKQNKDVKTIAQTLSKSALIAAEDRDQLVNVNQTINEQTVEHQTVKSKE